MLFLPEYQNANQYWELTNDNHGSGWIWVEATGKSNPLGWTPPDFSNGDWTAYPLEASATSFQQTLPLLADASDTLICRRSAEYVTLKDKTWKYSRIGAGVGLVISTGVGLAKIRAPFD
jgi:hypothetical protein